MAYQNSAAGALDNPQGDMSQMDESKPGENESGSEQSAEGSFFIPKDVLAGKSYKAGDKITLEVMGEDEDGDVEVCLPGSEGGNWQDELKTKLSEAGTESGMKGGMS